MYINPPSLPPQDSAFHAARPTCSIFAVSPVVPKTLPLAVRLVCKSTLPTEINLGENQLGNLRIAVDVPGEQPNYRQLHLPSLTYPGVVTITPEEPFEERINLRELEPSSVPDELQIAMEIEGGSSGEEPVKTNILRIKMVQLDSAQLATACENLASSIRRTYSFQQRSELASELASVRDPVAVATIASLLGKKMGIDNQLTDGLEAIGTQEAKDVLLGYVSHSTNYEDTQYAKSAINRMDHAGQR